MTKRKLPSLLLLIFLALFAGVRAVHAQATQTAPAPISDPLNALPVSDAVGYLDLGRILTEVVPHLFAKDPAALAKMMTALNEVNKKTGINILAIDRVAMGARFFGANTSDLKKEDIGIVILVHGSFDPNTFITALKRETKGRVDETTYSGKIIYSEPAPKPPKKRAEREIPAITILDANTIAVGDLPQVRSTIDALVSGSGRADSALLQLATRNPNALVSVAGNVPVALRESLKNSDPKEETEKAIVNALMGLRQIYSFMGTTATGFDATLGARFSTTEQAQSLADMLLGLRQQISTGIPDQDTRAMLEGVQINAQGDELQLSASVKNEIVQEFIVSTLKEEDKPKVIAATQAASNKAKHTTKSRRNRRRRRH
jgi:hypothetical protein